MPVTHLDNIVGTRPSRRYSPGSRRKSVEAKGIGYHKVILGYYILLNSKISIRFIFLKSGFNQYIHPVHKKDPANEQKHKDIYKLTWFKTIGIGGREGTNKLTFKNQCWSESIYIQKRRE